MLDEKLEQQPLFWEALEKQKSGLQLRYVHRFAVDMHTDRWDIGGSSREIGFNYGTFWQTAFWGGESSFEVLDREARYRESLSPWVFVQKMQTQKHRLFFLSPLLSASFRTTQLSEGGFLDASKFYDYDVMLYPISVLGIGVVSQDMPYMGSVSVEGERYAGFANMHQSGYRLQYRQFGLGVVYTRLFDLTLRGYTKGTDIGVFSVGKGHRLSLEMPVFEDIHGYGDMSVSEFSGQANPYNSSGTTSAQLSWERATWHGVVLGLRQSGNLTWELFVSDRGLVIRDSLLKTISDPRGEYGGAMGHVSFKNPETVYRQQSVSFTIRPFLGWFAGVDIGRLSVLGNYHQYETPLFFTYYKGTHALDIESLTYLTLMVAYSWDIFPGVRAELSGRQFVPLSLVRAAPVTQADLPVSESPSNTSSTDSTTDTLYWSGFAGKIGLSWEVF